MRGKGGIAPNLNPSILIVLSQKEKEKKESFVIMIPILLSSNQVFIFQQ